VSERGVQRNLCPSSLWGVGALAGLGWWGVRILGWKVRNFFDLKSRFMGLKALFTLKKIDLRHNSATIVWYTVPEDRSSTWQEVL
jgi:hypothetical protein